MEGQLTSRELRIQKKIKDSETYVFKAVFPGQANNHNTMFGGVVMYIMDEIAFMTVTRFCRKPIVTVSSDKVVFNHLIPAGTLVELIGTVTHVEEQVWMFVWMYSWKVCTEKDAKKQSLVHLLW